MNVNNSHLDNLNEQCYNLLASEYDASNHSTCRDFDVFTSYAVSNLIKFVNLDAIRQYLDTGTGLGISLLEIDKYLNANVQVDIVDISEGMINRLRNNFGTKIQNYYHSSIHTFIPDKKYDLIVSIMCDPYLTNSFVDNVYSWLSIGGYWLLTFPHYEWANQVRHQQNINKTIFKNNREDIIEGYSFCLKNNDFEKLLQSKFEVIEYVSFNMNDLKNRKNGISKINNFVLNSNPNILFSNGYILKRI